MSDWEQKPDLDEPPGKTDPRPSPSDPGWAEWVRKEANDAREKKYGPGTSKAYKISLTVERIGTVDFATEGTSLAPGRRNRLRQRRDRQQNIRTSHAIGANTLKSKSSGTRSAR